MPTIFSTPPVNRFVPPDHLFLLSPHNADFVFGRAASRLSERRQNEIILTVFFFMIMGAFLLRALADVLQPSLDLTDHLDAGNAGKTLAIVVAHMILVGGYAAYRIWRWDRLIQDGILLHGCVIKAEASSSRTDYTVRIRYEIMTPEGQTLRRSQSAIRNDLQNLSLPHRGVPVAVLYAPINITYLM